MLMERVYIAFMGRSIWGTFNSAWASALHYRFLPQKVYLVVNSCDKPKAELVGACSGSYTRSSRTGRISRLSPWTTQTLSSWRRPYGKL